MFSLFKKKNKLEGETIKRFKEAVKAIKYYMAVEEWEKCKGGIIEIKEKEQIGYKELMKRLDNEGNINENERGKQTRAYNKKIKTLINLEIELEKKEKKYTDARDKDRFKLRFKKIKEELENLKGIGKNDAALNLLTSFLEENKTNKYVVSLYNKEKKKIIKNREKEKKLENRKYKDNAKLEALKLIGKTANLDGEEDPEEKEKAKSKNFFQRMKDKLNLYKVVKEKLKRKRLLDEINILIEEESKVKREVARKKLASIHKGLIKEIRNNNMEGYELYGKILGADKISGDTFGLFENKEKYNFFLGDATGHGIRAGFIVTLLTRVFNEHVKKSSLTKLAFEINNSLKQNLKNRNFITGVFFEIVKKAPSKIRFVGMGHEPMFLFRSKDQTVEKVIPGGLAAGIRIMKDESSIKAKEIDIENGDVLVTYSDGIVESKNEKGEYYGFDRMSESFLKANTMYTNIEKIYAHVIDELKIFRGGASFDDDTTMLLIKRDINKDTIDDLNDEYLLDVKDKEHLDNSDVRKLKGKNRDEIAEELKKIKKLKETKNIIKSLEGLYYTGEILKLKQEAVRYIKEGYIDKKINFYLKKAIANESKYKVEQKEIKIRNKYNVLKELYKKGDTNTVISEIEDIIAKDGNI